MNYKNIVRVGLVAGFSICSGIASATPCDSVLSSYQSYVSSGLSANAGQILSSHPECFGGSSTSSRTYISASSFTQANAISSALSSRQATDGPTGLASLATTGMAAGGAASNFNVWGSATLNNTHHNYMNLNNFVTNGKNDVLTMVFGADYALTQSIVAGVSASLDDGNGAGLNTQPGSVQNRTANHGYVLAPYLGVQITRDLSFDASVGLGQGKLSTSGNTENQADRMFAAANLVYSRWFGPVQLLGRASYLHGEEDYDNVRDTQTNQHFAGTKAKNTIDQARVGVQASYWLNGFMPYASLGYVSDVHRASTQFGAGFDPIGKDAWLLGLGVNFISLANGITAGVAYNQEMGRTNQVSNHSLMANLNFRF